MDRRSFASLALCFPLAMQVACSVSPDTLKLLARDQSSSSAIPDSSPASNPSQTLLLSPTPKPSPTALPAQISGPTPTAAPTAPPPPPSNITQGNGSLDFSVKMSGGSLSTPYYSLSEGQETDNTLYDFAIKFRQTTYSYGDFGTEYLIIGLGSESGKFLRFIIAGITTGWSSMSEAE